MKQKTHKKSSLPKRGTFYAHFPGHKMIAALKKFREDRIEPILFDKVFICNLSNNKNVKCET